MSVFPEDIIVQWRRFLSQMAIILFHVIPTSAKRLPSHVLWNVFYTKRDLSIWRNNVFVITGSNEILSDRKFYDDEVNDVFSLGDKIYDSCHQSDKYKVSSPDWSFSMILREQIHVIICKYRARCSID